MRHVITPTSFLNPNKHTLQTVAQARACEREIIRDYHLIAQSELRGETAEERVAQSYSAGSVAFAERDRQSGRTQVHVMTRMERRKPRAVAAPREVKAREVADVQPDISIFDVAAPALVSEFDTDG